MAIILCFYGDVQVKPGHSVTAARNGGLLTLGSIAVRMQIVQFCDR